MSVQTNRKGLYILDADTPLTQEMVEEYIRDHEGKVERYIENEQMYKGIYPILDTKKPIYKPNNRLVVNFAKHIVDTLNGYFIGVPIKESHHDLKVNKFINEFIRRNDLQDNEAEISKMSAMYGHAFEYLYRDREAEIHSTYLSPVEGFMIYDDTVEEEPLYFVKYWRSADHKLHATIRSRKDDREIEAYSVPKPHYFAGVPVIEYIENEERMGAFDSVKTLMNALNKALSEKANDVEYFSDAYLVITGAEFGDVTIPLASSSAGDCGTEFSDRVIPGKEAFLSNIHDHRLIYLPDIPPDTTVEIKFLERPSGDNTQENLLNRLVDDIFRIAMVANISDETFSSASSGTALQFKLQPMKNLALNKERKFQSGLRRRWKLIFEDKSVSGFDKAAWIDIEYRFTRNVPQDLESEMKVMAGLEGIVSKETQLTLASFVDNVQEEMERLKAENTELINEAVTRAKDVRRGADDRSGVLASERA